MKSVAKKRDLADRYIRQSAIFSSQGVACAVIGVGSTGRQVALQLASMGVHSVQLVDFDKVDVVNLSSQGYHERDLKAFKCHATSRIMISTNTTIEVNSHCVAYSPELLKSVDVVFLCVDNIEVRKEIVESELSKQYPPKLFVDCRMSGESFRIITIRTDNKEDLEHYETTLFKKEEAYQERCTSKSTIYCANIAAGFMVCEFTKYYRGLSLFNDYLVNIAGCCISPITENPDTEIDFEKE